MHQARPRNNIENTYNEYEAEEESPPPQTSFRRKSEQQQQPPRTDKNTYDLPDSFF